MKYISTRNFNNENSKLFSEIIIAGTASDGGLYIPQIIPHISQSIMSQWKNLPYHQLATNIISLFANDIEINDIKTCCQNAYKNFNSGVINITKASENIHFLELFHGPTLSFKDYAMQFLGQITELILQKTHSKKHIITATSGDTGPAAIYGFKNSNFVDITVYYPKFGVSKFQEHQMTKANSDSVKTIGLDKTFDECQQIVKQAFAEDTSGNLMTVNSINIGRIVAQIVYYFATFIKFDFKPLNCFIPTGNFGNVFAGFLAKQMGANINLNICVNENDTIYRFYQDGIFKPQNIVSTTSNAIDIANPSNFERILWYLSQDKNDVIKYMNDLKTQGFYKVSDDFLQKFRQEFSVFKVNQNAVNTTQNFASKTFGTNICPHTAVALNAALSNKKDETNIVFATAHSKKFV